MIKWFVSVALARSHIIRTIVTNNLFLFEPSQREKEEEEEEEEVGDVKKMKFIIRSVIKAVEIPTQGSDVCDIESACFAVGWLFIWRIFRVSLVLRAQLI